MEIIPLLLITLAASIVGTLAGFGISTVMVPVLVMFLPLKEALLLVAVVHDAEGLTTEQMERFTRWTNLSEATFLLPPTEPRLGSATSFAPVAVTKAVSSV